MRTALGLALCLAFNLGCILYYSPYYTPPRPVFFIMMGLTLAFLGLACLLSQSQERAKAMGAAAYVIFAGRWAWA